MRFFGFTPPPSPTVAPREPAPAASCPPLHGHGPLRADSLPGRSHQDGRAMNTDQAKRVSKFLSLVLRHEPEKVGITLDEAGWVPVDELLDAVNAHGLRLTLEELQEVVDN